METTELLKKVRKIEIKTRGLSRNIFAGEYHSAFKGRGMTFSEVREYQYGDDIRSIDWNVTARFNKPFIKVFEEERELTVMLLIDLSGSSDFATTGMLKRSLIAEVAAVLSFSAIQNNDKIGVILFTDKVEKFIPPKKGRTHTLRIIRELIDFKPEGKGTNITAALRYLTNAIKKRSITFIVSDFVDPDPDTLKPKYDEALRIAARKHDMVALRVSDPREKELPSVGMIHINDAETGKLRLIDASNTKVRHAYHNWWRNVNESMDQSFVRCGIDKADLRTDQDYVKPLMLLFKKR